MNFLTDSIQELNALKEIDKALKKKETPIYVHGVIRDVCGHFVYTLSERLQRPIVVIVDTETRAKELRDFLSELTQCSYFPKKDINYYNVRPIDDPISKMRIATMTDVLFQKTNIVVTTLEALQRKISKHTLFYRKIRTIRKDQTIDLPGLIESLVDLSYERVDTIEASGQFAVRGGIIDIYPIQQEHPVRIELFDDEIDSMRVFDVMTQRSMENCDEVTIVPATEFIWQDDMKKRVIKNISNDIDKRIEHPIYQVDNDKTIEKFTQIIQAIEGDLSYEEDLAMPYLQKRDAECLIDYFKISPLILFEDITRSYDYNREREKNRLEDFTYLMEKGEIFNRHEKVYLDLSDLLHHIREFDVLNTSQLTKTTGLLQPKYVITLRAVEAPKFNKQISQMIDFLDEYTRKGYKIILCNPSKDLNSTKDTLLEHKIPTIVSTDLNAAIKSGQVLITDRNVLNGFEYHDAKFIVLTHREIYGQGKTRRKTKKTKSKKDIIRYSDLNVGDYVVHENHGIGKYEGLEKIEVNHVIKDYIVISYRGNDKLYIPTDQMALVQKYVGAGEEKAPIINRLEGTEWKKTKTKAKKAIDEMAQDLVALYAKRAKMKGHAFEKDTDWQREFEESFLYEETDSQIRAVEEIKADMEKDHPMDRILCGDVGYGKTEVALRAAFKAIMEGKQVAFLVPTTILCNQHYHTMVERFSDYPIQCEMLSRFRTPAQQKEIFKGLRFGTIDIVVGTHKLLSDQVEFKDLGLLIIDEEQRFGVRHKDKIKSLKENLDVLTLSATPIPRTLQMGLVGIRDMSLLDEPPENRSPVNTYVMEYNPIAIRDAIEREVYRGGQVYFVYNRIDSILSMQKELQELVPDVEIAVCHGRMTERTLENIMTDFAEGKYDVLLCTTIIETGLDIQNVNTIIIYNADHMGLSQMYQLKGRVGRTDRVSYAYFTYPQNKVLTEVAEKRLMAIRDFTEFGSGFKIAMRDLELRGAGNILGESQSGHITSIGYDLYVRMLEEAVQEIKGDMPKKKKADVEIDIKINGFISEEYISNSNEKMEMYQKIAMIEKESEYEEIVDELIDRYGDVPRSVKNIMDISLLKSWMAKLGFSSLKEKNGNLILRYDDMALLTMDDLSFLSESFRGELSFDFTKEPKLICGFPNKDLTEVLQLLNKLISRKGVL